MYTIPLGFGSATVSTSSRAGMALVLFSVAAVSWWLASRSAGQAQAPAPAQPAGRLDAHLSA